MCQAKLPKNWGKRRIIFMDQAAVEQHEISDLKDTLTENGK